MINSCENNRLIKLNGLKILCIADTHRRLNEDELSIIENYRNSVDLILTLGDIPMDSLNKINGDYGVLGNHDSFNGIDKSKNLNLRIVCKNGILLGGFQGSSRYKKGNFVMYSHKESCDLLDNLRYCDIFISHDSCMTDYYCQTGEIDAHSGLMGIDRYIEKKQPLLHIHGHHHKNNLEYKYSVPSLGVYGIVLVEIINGELRVTDLR